MTGKIFLDTNLFVYSMDKYNPEKMVKSRSILKKTIKEYNAAISTQVMQEFYVTATKKLQSDPITVKNILRQIENFEIINTSPELIYEAIDCSILNQISFWDALIIAAAESAKCEEIWTEDLNEGQIIRGVKIVNPFSKN